MSCIAWGRGSSARCGHMYAPTCSLGLGFMVLGLGFGVWGLGYTFLKPAARAFAIFCTHCNRGRRALHTKLQHYTQLWRVTRACCHLRPPAIQLLLTLGGRGGGGGCNGMRVTACISVYVRACARACVRARAFSFALARARTHLHTCLPLQHSNVANSNPANLKPAPSGTGGARAHAHALTRQS
jgi:hypothetical protein